MLSSEVLPAPFGPMMERMRPFGNVDRTLVDRDDAAEPLGRTLDRHLHGRGCDAIGTLGNIHARRPCVGTTKCRRPMSSRPARMDEPSQVLTAWPCNG